MLNWVCVVKVSRLNLVWLILIWVWLMILVSVLFRILIRLFCCLWLFVLVSSCVVKILWWWLRRLVWYLVI